jgi:hypothetical protein
MFVALKNFLDTTEEKKVWQYLIAILAGLVLVVGGLVYWHYAKISSLQAQLVVIDKNRARVRVLLEKNRVIKQSRAEIGERLAKDTDFKIKEFFSRIAQEKGADKQLSREPEFQSHDLNNGYTEIALDVSLSNTTLQMVCDLLYEIGKTRRVYTKDLTITKALKNDTVDVMMVIATLYPKVNS